MRDVDDLHRDLRRRYWHPDNNGIPLPPPPTPHRPRRDWRTRLDARIGRCSGCDGFTWDNDCRACGQVVHKGGENDPTWENRNRRTGNGSAPGEPPPRASTKGSGVPMPCQKSTEPPPRPQSLGAA